MGLSPFIRQRGCVYLYYIVSIRPVNPFLRGIFPGSLNAYSGSPRQKNQKKGVITDFPFFSVIRGVERRQKNGNQ